MESIIVDQVRIQLLSQELVRIETKYDSAFLDQNTFFISQRNDFQNKVEYFKNDYEDKVIISFNNYQIIIPKHNNGLKNIEVYDSYTKELLYKYHYQENSGELPPIAKTPRVFSLSDNPRILAPKVGYSYHGNIKDNGYIFQKNVEDIYLFFCENDFIKLRKMYVELVGRTELVRLAHLGLWNSRYYAYDETSAKQMILDYYKYQIPLDNFVLDTDWRKTSDRGIGYDVDTNLFPNIKRFFAFAHEHNVEVMFNDHPEPFEGASSLFDAKEVQYRENRLQEHLQSGLDTWWYDRNWHTKLISPISNIPCETFGMYLFYEITKHHYQHLANNELIYRRPIIMGNVDNILNGTYSGISTSATHRYSIQWTGDIDSSLASLGQEIKNMIRASNNLITYVNSDCGGHIGDPDDEAYIRWMQFGTFSPIFRPHCTNSLPRSREPWLYEKKTLDIVREYIKLRYRLLAIIYSEAHNSYLLGQPLFKSIGYFYPNDKKALNIEDQYMLGANIVLAPIYDNHTFELKKEHYQSPVKVCYFDNRYFKGTPILTKEIKTIGHNLNHQPIEKGVPIYDFSAIYETSIAFDEEIELSIESDDGVTVIIDGKLILEDNTTHAALKKTLTILKPHKTYKLKIAYFQAGGEAVLRLYYRTLHNDLKKRFYLPHGSWIDPFDGHFYEGGRFFSKHYEIDKMPIFIKRGALIPLLNDANNTHSLDWSKVCFDFYPSIDANNIGELYEDDEQTTAYKYGAYRISQYSSHFDRQKNCFVFVFNSSSKDFIKNDIVSREITIKYHLLKDFKNIDKVLLNGKSINYNFLHQEEKAFILTTNTSTTFATAIMIKFQHDLNDDDVVEVYLNKKRFKNA